MTSIRSIPVAVAWSVCAALLLMAAPLHAWNHPEIEWKSVATEHFRIQYHPGLESVAAEAAAIAESLYEPLTTLYGYEPDGPIYFNISDFEDDPQGATYFYLNRIDISAAPYDFWFRGSAAWLPNVIAHEFTHMISVQRSMKFPRWLPAGYVQAIGFESEKRPDVITGYPNLLVSVPVPGELLPNWFAEGMAQYQCAAGRHDIWDSHRDMLLRSAFVGNRLLTIDEMGVFGKNSLRSELVYNQGFSLVRFIEARYGAAAVSRLAKEMAGLRAWTFDGPCRRALGIGQDELYRFWVESLETAYYPVIANVRRREVAGERAGSSGFVNLFPEFDRRDGSMLIVTNDGSDYLDMRLVRLMPDGARRTLVGDVSGRASIAPDGSRICFSRMTRRNDKGWLRNDLFLCDASGGNERRLTKGLRASYPEWSPEGARIACVVTENGSHRIALVDARTGAHTFATPAALGREYSVLSWGTRGILAARFEGQSRDIVLIDPATGSETALLDGPADERDPRWDDTGEGFFYASDRTGIFNVYHRSLGDTIDVQITNVVGGAFTPEQRGSALWYAAYGPDGFEIRRLGDWRAAAVPADPALDNALFTGARSGIACPVRASRGGTGASPAAADMASATKFDIEYTSLFVYPRLMVYDGSLRAGAFLDSGDFLDRQSVFAGAVVGANGEFDLNLAITTRQFTPTFGFELYRTRKLYSYKEVADLSGQESLWDIKVRYDLWDAYFTCGLELRPTTPFARNEAILQYNHGEYGVNLELWEMLERAEFKGEGGWNYYKADEISLLWNYRKIRREIDADINPRLGRGIGVEITRAYDRLASGVFEFNFKPLYDNHYFWRGMLTYEEHLPLPFWRHALTMELKGGLLSRSDIDDFFYLYLGSAQGLRGYSYYSLGGTNIAMARLTYRFPVWRGIDRQAMQLYAGSLYAGAFFEAGNAWTGTTFNADDIKRDAGFELRLKGFSFYSYPIALSLTGAYGLDEVVYTKPFEFTTVYEGERWKWYGSVLFGF